MSVFENTPIEKLWIGCKWITVGVEFLLSLAFLFWSVAIFVSDRDDYGFGAMFVLLSVLLMWLERNLAHTLREEEAQRQRRLDAGLDEGLD